MTLRSLDLFSGIGGLTIALRGVADPVGYCDIDAESRAILASRMSDGSIPTAPVHADVRDLPTSCSLPHADIVVGGFPCTGFSQVGKRDMFGNDQSALFFDMMRVVDSCGADAVFLENVPKVTHARRVIVRELCEHRDFEARWTLVSASDVGAPHSRLRWFCLAARPGALMSGEFRAVAPGTYAAYSWDGDGPRRTDPEGLRDRLVGRSHRTRCEILGNSVVPDVARTAFFRLLTAGSVANAVVDGDTEPRVWVARPDAISARSGYAAFGRRSVCIVPPGTTHDECDGRAVCVNVPPPTRDGAAVNGRRCNMSLDPFAFGDDVPERTNWNVSRTLKELMSSVPLSRWATPRRGKASRSRVLTRRTRGDLPTQVAFEVSTGPDRGCTMAPRFVEWLMGYPLDYTKREGGAGS